MAEFYVLNELEQIDEKALRLRTMSKRVMQCHAEH